MAWEATGVIYSNYITQSQVTLSLKSNLAITSKKNGFSSSYYNAWFLKSSKKVFYKNTFKVHTMEPFEIFWTFNITNALSM